MRYYVMVMDVWSNVSFDGPFDTEDEARAHRETIPPRFDRNVITEDEKNANVAEFGEP